MEDSVKYPYLGKKNYNGQDYVVLFTEKNYGVVVMSEISDVEALRFGKIGDFDETMFDFLPNDQCVRLNN